MSDLGVLYGLPADPNDIGVAPPTHVTAFNRKYAYEGDYAPLANIIPNLPSNLQQTIYNVDADRVARGQRPITTPDTLAALQTILTGEPFTKPATAQSPIDLVTELPKAAYRDLKSIVTNIPRMPAQIVKEVTDLPRFAEKYGEQLDRTGNPIAALAASPGVRFIPGSFVVENLAAGTPTELVKHPLFTAMDVAPYVGRGVKAALKSPRMAAFKETEGFQRLATSNAAMKARSAWGKDPKEATSFITAAMAEMLDLADDTRPHISSDILADKKYAAQLEKESGFNKKAQKIGREYADIPVDRMADLKNSLELGELNTLNMNAKELAFVADLRDVRNDMRSYALSRKDLGKDSLTEVDDLRGGKELYRNDQADAIYARRDAADHARSQSDLRAAVQAGDVNTVRSLVEEYISPTTRNGRKRPVPRRREILDNVEKFLKYSGYDTTPFRQAITDTFQKKGDPARIVDALNNTYNRTVPHFAVDDISGAIRELAAADHVKPSTQRSLETAAIEVEAGAHSRARSRVSGLRKSFTGDDVSYLKTISESIGRARLNDGLKQRLAPHTESKAVTRARQAEAKFARTPPATFMPLVEKKVRRRLADEVSGLEAALQPDELTRLLQAVDERNFQYIVDAGLDPKLLARAYKDAAKTWLDMKYVDGLNPEYVHRATASEASITNFPPVQAAIRTPAAMKKRTMDVTPHYQDAAVAVQAEAMGWLMRTTVQRFTDQIIGRFAEQHNVLLQRYFPAARRRAAKDPRFDVIGHADALIKREWTLFDPNKTFPFMKGRFTGMPKEGVWLPKTVATTIEDYFKMNTGPFSQATAPLINGFRTSVLALSPRWHIYNILGGMIMLAGRTNPFTVWKHLGEATRMANDLRRGLDTTSIPSTMRAQMGKAKLFQSDLAYIRGGRMGEFVATLKDRSPIIRRTADGFNKVTDASYRFNQFVDDIYRAMGYLYGYDKAGVKGMTREAQIKAGVELSRKIMPDWLSMTPIERNVMRSAMPFYGFMSHMLRYVYTYPADHPVRASIIANFAEAELADMDEATPHRFMEMFLFGEPDERGRKRSLSWAGFNPFSGVADLMTMSGVISQINPLVGAALQQVGVDPRKGSASIYPDVQYDPETGRMQVKSPNFLESVFQKTLPQADWLRQMLTPTSDLNRLRATNPEVADAVMRGALGIPSMVRRVSESEEQAKAELTRREVASRDRAEALRGGIYTMARRDPQLAAYLDQLRQIAAANPQAFQQYSREFSAQAVGLDPTPGTNAIGTAQRVLLGSILG